MLRAGYSGYQHGLLAEAFNVVGVVSATALASNFQPIISQWALPWWRFDPAIAQFAIFLTLLVIGLIVFGVLARLLARLMTWKMSWLAQLVGLLLGAVRGAWVAGLVMLIALASGSSYLGYSIAARSWSGPIVAEQMRAAVAQTRLWYPGERLSSPAVPDLSASKAGRTSHRPPPRNGSHP